MTRVEYRNRSKRAPGGEFRMVIGEATTKAEARRLEALRQTCKELAGRGEWDVLEFAKAGRTTLAEVHRLIRAHGHDGYRRHLALHEPEPVVVSVPTLREHVARWLAHEVEHDGTRKVYEHGTRRLVEFRDLGDRPWFEVYKHDVQDAVADARKDLAKNTVRTLLGSWGAFFSWAIDREDSEAEAEGRAPRITESPVQRAKRWGRPEVTRHRFFRPGEYDDLLRATIAPMRAQYATLVLTGLRITEFIVLPPAHVGPKKISVGPWGGWKPKTERGVRDIPVHRTKLAPLLAEYTEEWAGERSFFVNPNTGEPWSYAAFAARMKADVEAAGMVYGQRVDGDVQPEGVTPHVCRHTFATWLCQRDVQLVKIAELMGDTVETVRIHYAHHLPTDLDQAVNRL